MALIKQGIGKVDDFTLPGDHVEVACNIDALHSALQSASSDEKRRALQVIEELSCDDAEVFLADIMVLAEQDSAESVMEMAFVTLEAHINDDITDWLIRCLSSEVPYLRNQAIDVLQRAPTLLAPHMDKLLQHDDPDVRIFTLDILGLLPHPRVPEWLQIILERDQHVNVIGAALDRAAQLADPALLDTLVAVKARFSDVAYIVFCCDLAIERIKA